MRTNRTASILLLRTIPLSWLIISAGSASSAPDEENTPPPVVRARIQLSRTPPSLLEEPKFDPVEFARFKATQAESLKLRSVLQDAAEGLATDPEIKQEVARNKSGTIADWLVSGLK